MPIERNCKILDGCTKASEVRSFVLALSKEELQVKFGSKVKQCNANYGILIEAICGDKIMLYKKPSLRSCLLQLRAISEENGEHKSW